MSSSVRAYRSSATEGASHIDILLACYDALVEAIRMAGIAVSKGDVASRCRYSERALLLIGHMESWIPLLDDPELATSLSSFYQYLRAEVLRLQLCRELDMFVNLALEVCEIRAAWQRKQTEGLAQSVTVAEPHLSFREHRDSTSHFEFSA